MQKVSKKSKLHIDIFGKVSYYLDVWWSQCKWRTPKLIFTALIGNGRGFLLPKSGRLTQLVEWQPVKLCVAGSNPASSAIFKLTLIRGLFYCPEYGVEYENV